MFPSLPLLAFLLGVSVSPWMNRALAQSAPSVPLPEVTSVAQADAVCGNCHRDLLVQYLKTPMANASGAAHENAVSGEFYQSSARVSYRISEQGNSVSLSYARQGDAGLTGSHQLSYFLGSGHLGTTYLYSLNGYLFESPIAYYAKLHGYDLKPGYQQLQSMPPALPMDPKCMRCHMSGVQRDEPGTRNRFSGLPFLHGGITCEGCHGDTERHVASRGTAAVINPSKLDPEARDSICISCHLEGDTSVEHKERSILDYRPGDHIDDYISYFIYTGDETSRSVSEVEELSVSKCKRMSGARMSCTTCHDPHYKPAPEEQVTFYRRKCLSCHTGAAYATNHHSEEPDCTRCHMPKGKSQDVPHVAWTDHRIRIHPEAASMTLTGLGPRNLTPFLSPSSTSRDLAVAYYSLTVNGDFSQEERARRLLLEAESANTNDATILASLGYLAQRRRETDRAQGYYERTLKIDPKNSFALNNLAGLLANQQKFEPARQLWEQLLQQNEALDIPGLNLAAVDCRMGQSLEAQRILHRVLLYSPDEPVARRELRAIESGQKDCSANLAQPH